jgi:glycosyltransferase involved in cell wall biosynthesis
LCSLGLSLDKPTNLNYLYSLPNKLFDYIYCGVPVVVSPVVEVSRIVQQYEIGKVLNSVEPQEIAETVKQALANKAEHERSRQNCTKAAAELNWENERAKLEALIKQIV